MTRLRDLVFRVRMALGFDRGGIDWSDDGPDTSAAMWAELDAIANGHAVEAAWIAGYGQALEDVQRWQERQP